MNVCSMKLRVNGKTKKTYHFSSVNNAAVFQKAFEGNEKVTFEVLYEDLPKSTKLMNEILRSPSEYGKKEYNKIFCKNE